MKCPIVVRQTLLQRFFSLIFPCFLWFFFCVFFFFCLFFLFFVVFFFFVFVFLLLFFQAFLLIFTAFMNDLNFSLQKLFMPTCSCYEQGGTDVYISQDEHLRTPYVKCIIKWAVGTEKDDNEYDGNYFNWAHQDM